jgi:DNA-binding transcriptional ArsR family regulator
MRSTHRRRSESDRLDAVFAALSDPTRRTILARLSRKEFSVTELSEPLSISMPAVSRHLRVLETAGLISRSKRGRVHYCRVRDNALRHAANWILQQRAFWEQQLDAVARFLEEEQS